MSKEMSPQAGIVTSLDIQNRRAKVFLPLFNIETDWIAVAKNIIYSLVNIVGEVDILTVGDEVAVIFLNGDLNDGRVIARF